ncbi:protein of unknown function DUF350 [Leptolyngbyaceae cyanobacterium JSC-12]|nr:protein of unknown function DUF350 [Leptolyngbyaceae cyanobacterium JSC-12]
MMPFLQKLAETTAWSVVGVVLLFGSLWLFDKLDPIDFRQEIRDGNLAAGVIVAAVVLAIAAIVVTILLTP